MLEIGHGHAVVLGTLLRGLGAKSYSSEYSPTPWVSPFHVPFYTKLHQHIHTLAASGSLGEYNIQAATEFAHSCGKNISGLTTLQTTSEALSGVPTGTVDFSFSNAVFEHIIDLESTFRSLTRVTTKGGMTCHQVDLRYHETGWKTIWDFMLHPDEEYGPEQWLHYGNRFRLQEFLDVAHKYGWEIDLVNLQHEEASEEVLNYARETLKKLRKCSNCRYQNWTKDDLDGCTSNGTPMTSIFFCARYTGMVRYSQPARPPCGVDTWVRQDSGIQLRGIKASSFPKCG